MKTLLALTMSLVFFTAGSTFAQEAQRLTCLVEVHPNASFAICDFIPKVAPTREVALSVAACLDEYEVRYDIDRAEEYTWFTARVIVAMPYMPGIIPIGYVAMSTKEVFIRVPVPVNGPTVEATVRHELIHVLTGKNHAQIAPVVFTQCSPNVPVLLPNP